MLGRAQVRKLIVSQLQAQLGPTGVTVVENRALPTTVEQLPMITVSTPHEKKDGQDRSVPFFKTTVTVVLVARVTAATDALASDAAEIILEMIETAVIASQPVLDLVSWFPSVDSAISLDTTAGSVIAQVTMHVGCEIEEIFDPSHPIPMWQIQGQTGFADIVGAVATQPLPKP